MGWFDENHPMGQDADDAIDEMLGLNKWYKDPQPASSSAPPKRVERPEAEWDSTKWRRSNFSADVRWIIRSAGMSTNSYV